MKHKYISIYFRLDSIVSIPNSVKENKTQSCICFTDSECEVCTAELKWIESKTFFSFFSFYCNISESDMYISPNNAYRDDNTHYFLFILKKV